MPIDEICSNGSGPAQPDRTVIKSLGDGTDIIEQLGRCMRVRYRQCYTKCLPPDARIATPRGDVAISALHIGDDVWTQDANGKRVAGHVEDISSPVVAGEHHVAHLVLADGRTVTVSPQHPALGDQRVQDLRAGDRYDGTTVVELTVVRYTGNHTFDIRVSGDTGVYWADSIPLRSTLAN